MRSIAFYQEYQYSRVRNIIIIFMSTYKYANVTERSTFSTFLIGTAETLGGTLRVVTGRVLRRLCKKNELIVIVIVNKFCPLIGSLIDASQSGARIRLLLRLQ